MGTSYFFNSLRRPMKAPFNLERRLNMPCIRLSSNG